MLTTQTAPALCSSLTHAIRPAATAVSTAVSRTQVGHLVSHAFGFSDYHELLNSDPQLITPEFCKRFKQLLLQDSGVEWDVPPMSWPWPKCISFTSGEIRGLWNDCLASKEGELYDTDIMRSVEPIILPDGKGRWILSPESRLPKRYFEAVLGQDNVVSIPGHNKAFNQLKERAKNGDFEAMLPLAIRFIQIEDYQSALGLLRAAADAGNSEAMAELAMMYMLGMGVDKDLEQAKKYYEMASVHEVPQALHALGASYDMGGAFEDDYELSFSYHQRAVIAGNHSSIGCLAAMYYRGRGVTKDLQKAKQLLLDGAKVGEAYSANLLALILEEEHGYANETCFDLYELASMRGEINGNYNLARCYLFGLGCVRSVGMAIKHFEIAAEQGDIDAMASLGMIYMNGEGGVVNDDEGIKWILKAVGRGNVKAKNFLGLAYLKGFGIEPSLERANYWFEEAAEQGEPEAMFNLSISYSLGRGVEVDYKKAFELCLCAANGGVLPAMNTVGTYYLKGLGVEKDNFEGYHWIRLAAEYGEPQAQDNLPYALQCLECE